MERIDAVIAVFKKEGITSNELLTLVKLKLKRLGLKKLKVGHGGTLDKFAEGVMVVGIGDGTKRMKDYLKGNKEYTAVGVLGIGTDTYDRDGNIVCEKVFTHVDDDALKESLKKFTGKIEQVPPVYSALKINGKRASDLVREGKNPEMKSRMVKIYKLDLITFDSPNFTIDVECSGGTYIRSLIHDIGQDLKTCAYMSKLTRTKQGKFTLDDAVEIDRITLDLLRRK